MDVFSRKIVGWEVHERECGELAAQLLYKTKLKEGLIPHEVTLHSDNGAPMKSQSMIAMMERLGVRALLVVRLSATIIRFLNHSLRP